jgi:cyclopentanol dehydrogenase
VEETSEENWDAVMGVNVTGAFLGIRLAIPEMRRAGGGSIINISSTAGLVGDFRSAPYGASKGAIRLLTRATAIQYARDGIRANSVHPGPVDAPMYHEIRPDAASRDAGVSRTAMGRMGTVDEIAYGVLYLASDEASFVTGAELAIDGGMTAQ